MKSLKCSICIIILLSIFASCTKDDDVKNNKQSGNEDDASVVNPDYTSVDWEQTQIYECKPEEGVFSFSATNETKNIVQGSVLSIDVDTMGYIAIVKEVKVDDDKVTIKSEKGSLCDIFADYDFTLSSQEASVLTRSVGGDVFNPTKILVDGKEVSCQHLIETRTTRATPLTEHLWDWGGNFDGEVLFSTANAKIYLKEANYSASLDLNLNLSFGQRSQITTVAEANKQYRSQALKIGAAVSGSISSKFVIQADVQGKATIQEKEDELWKHNIFKPIRMKFVVQGVPVYITLSADLYRGASLEAEGQISCYTGFHSNAQGSIGFEWSQAKGISPTRSFDMNNEFVYPTIEGKGKITAKTWLYPRLHLTLYEQEGPSFDIKPYLGCELSGGYKEQLLSSSNDYCAWQLRTFVGLDAAAGLSLMFMNSETKHYDTGKLHIMERNLYESPTNIAFFAAQNEKPRTGVKGQVSFKVYDTNHLSGQSIATPLPQIVKFEGNGILSSKYGIAKNGLVSVGWTPLQANDVLKAVLYNANGQVIKSASYGPCENVKSCPDNNHPHMIDLGFPSGTKWACCNVGARSPEQYGDYFAWGETSPKSDYTWNNYAYQDGNGNYIDIGFDIAGTKYDAATANWGDPWCMPTLEQIKELVENSISNWISKNGVNGREFIAPNGENIFIPAAGFRRGGDLRFAGEYGNCWSSMLDESGEYEVCALGFDFGYAYGSYGIRYDGHSVRPVRKN